MKICLISDIHANVVALEAVLKDINSVDKILCAGDLVGYNPYPNETIELLMANNIHCISGEHDKAVITGDIQWFNREAAQTLKWTVDQLTRENMRFLETLSDRMELDGITVHHGNPNSIKDFSFEYDQEKICGILDTGDRKVFAFGHTHVPIYKKCGDRIILNPGSVGQPRDGDNKASYAIYNTQTQEFVIRRVNYDYKKVQSFIHESGLPEIMAERLAYGR